MALDVLLTAIAEGSVTPEQAYDAITKKRTMDLDFALVDVERAQRCGHPEAVLGEGKTPEQIAQILESLAMTGDAALATRVSPDAVPFLDETLGCLGGRYHELARCFYIPAAKPSGRQGQIAVVSAGTTDGPVAAEAALTASLLGYEVDRIEDVGVAGLHRLLNQLERLRTAQVIIVVAGMEGALPSVVAGLIDRPVIGVPTSVGYGVSAGGIAALMGMLGSCAAGVTVVNIDNGFGAAYAAGLICGARTARVSS
mgnify:CR=1 FL=1